MCIEVTTDQSDFMEVKEAGFCRKNIQADRNWWDQGYTCRRLSSQFRQLRSQWLDNRGDEGADEELKVKVL